jgi:hypothetical protein
LPQLPRARLSKSHFDAFPAGLVTGDYTLKLSVLTPDEDPANDILNGTLSAIPPLNGTYTIGGTSPDYANFTDAIADLVAYGISTTGTGVTFNVVPEYTEPIPVQKRIHLYRLIR